jgi:hypothetical protein
VGLVGWDEIGWDEVVWAGLVWWGGVGCGGVRRGVRGVMEWGVWGGGGTQGMQSAPASQARDSEPGTGQPLPARCVGVWGWGVGVWVCARVRACVSACV